MKLRFLLLGLLTAGLTFAVACGDLEEDCTEGETDDTGATCVCTDDSDATCDPDEDEECSCSFVGGGETNNGETNNGETNNGETNNGETNNGEVNNYRFVLVEDLTANTSGAYPGVDLDAVEVVKASGGSFYATAVDDSDFGPGSPNEAVDVTAALGAPDDNCAADDTKFVALGGVGGYILVSFGTDTDDVTIANGDSIRVHEIGDSSCPGQYDDDPYSVSVSISTNSGDFVEIATNAEGDGAIPVTGLP